MNKYCIIWGMDQYPELNDNDRSQMVGLDYFNDLNGFSEDDFEQIKQLGVSHSINRLKSLYDIFIIRIK
jgi:hypothetical protein